MPTRLTKEEKEAIEWTQKHRAVAERRTRMLKGTGIFLLFVAIGIALVLAFAIAFALAFAIALVFAIALAFAAVALIYTPDNIYTPDKYGREAVVGIISGVSIGIVLALIYIAPMASIAQYPISMQVFYPNQSNITITQNCTAFTTSSSGYFNGQPINPQNTTTCILPQNMALDNSNPFNCNIKDNSIICTGTPPGQNVTWQGTILNVSTR